ncbi:MAG TPA: patatin-like phospholipase family protein [Verrucomicrobiae bacterium]|nr:patatin-like phospholipase family protein [Verrucomicrobiae bacterium]
MQIQNRRPKIGIALSGGAGRAIGHIAVLDVLRENNIPIDIIVGCSSGALVAVSYAAGTLDYLRNIFTTLTAKQIWSLWSIRGARGGLFHLHKVDPIFKKLTRELNFEELPIKVGVTAADIESGQLATLTRGDIIQGLKASVAIPGLFEPVVINNRILLEGGLINIVPTLPTKQLGADIVIGVNVAISKFFYQKKMPIFRLIRSLRRAMGIDYVQHEIINPISSQIIDQVEKQFGVKKRRVPNAFRIFAWAVDHSYNIEEEWNEEKQSCDIMIEPPVKEYGKVGLKRAELIYDECRKSAIAALPQIKKIIEEYQSAQQPVQERVIND